MVAGGSEQLVERDRQLANPLAGRCCDGLIVDAALGEAQAVPIAELGLGIKISVPLPAVRSQTPTARTWPRTRGRTGAGEVRWQFDTS